MFVDITSKENKYKEDKKTDQKQNRICSSGNVLTGHIVDFTTHISNICI
jgi:hypothetical protein